MQLFVNNRRAIAEPAVKTKRVVPRLQEVEDLAPRLFTRGEVRARQQLALKGGDEAFPAAPEPPTARSSTALQPDRFALSATEDAASARTHA